ncbi:MAG: hypothetical protein KGQ59_11965 [Bdellovibrionales bacterium]|nr:hypothetical protein [Bdellovibrionales bacterium]
MVLWLDKNTFATGLLERAFKSVGAPFYSIADLSDFSYLVADLRPSVIVLDVATYLEFREVFDRQYQGTPELRSLPFVLVGEGEVPGVSTVIGRITRPFDPFQISGQIRTLLNAQ